MLRYGAFTNVLLCLGSEEDDEEKGHMDRDLPEEERRKQV